MSLNLNFSLHPAQLEVFNDPHPFKVVVAGRRFGKTYLSAVTCIIEALKMENEHGYDLSGMDVWYIAPTFQQGKDIMWHLLKKLAKDVTEGTIENTATIKLINGRQIKIKGSDRPDTLVGVGLSFVVLDEYSIMKADVWDRNIFPTLSDVEGGALFIGTPRGKNHFYDVYLQGQSDKPEWAEWKSWHFNSLDNPFLNKKRIEQARSQLSSQLFKQEFEASFTASGGAVFSEDMIEFADEPAHGEYFISVDLAGFSDAKEISNGNSKRLDETAIAIVKVNEQGWWVKNIDHGRWGIRETALRILKHAKDHKCMRVGIEKGALYNAISPYLEESKRRVGIFPVIVPTTHGNQKKTDRIVWALQGRLQSGRLKFNTGPYMVKFKDQLIDFPNPLSHDDLIDALAYIDQVAVVSFASHIDIEEWLPMDEVSGY